MCSHDLTDADGALTLGAADAGSQAEGNRVNVAAEIRSTKARLKEITNYIEDLDESLAALKLQAEEAAILEEQAAAALDEATSPSVSPFLAARDDLHHRREQVLRLIDQAESTAKLQEGLAKRTAAVERHEAQIARLKEELAQLGDATYDRDLIIAQVSSRYGDLLREWRYPKLSQPFIKPDLTPFVRGEPYQKASSGARTLLTLAWQLAVFEIAVETSAAHPGFLMIDSPQKNLGHGGTLDAVIADAVAIDDFYHHLSVWLTDRGAKAQLIIIDNSPPLLAEGNVVARYSRKRGPASLRADRGRDQRRTRRGHTVELSLRRVIQGPAIDSRTRTDTPRGMVSRSWSIVSSRKARRVLVSRVKSPLRSGTRVTTMYVWSVTLGGRSDRARSGPDRRVVSSARSVALPKGVRGEPGEGSGHWLAGQSGPSQTVRGW